MRHILCSLDKMKYKFLCNDFEFRSNFRISKKICEIVVTRLNYADLLLNMIDSPCGAPLSQQLQIMSGISRFTNRVWHVYVIDTWGSQKELMFFFCPARLELGFVYFNSIFEALACFSFPPIIQLFSFRPCRSLCRMRGSLTHHPKIEVLSFLI